MDDFCKAPDWLGIGLQASPCIPLQLWGFLLTLPPSLHSVCQCSVLYDHNLIDLTRWREDSLDQTMNCWHRLHGAQERKDPLSDRKGRHQSIIVLRITPGLDPLTHSESQVVSALRSSVHDGAACAADDSAQHGPARLSWLVTYCWSQSHATFLSSPAVNFSRVDRMCMQFARRHAWHAAARCIMHDAVCGN